MAIYGEAQERLKYGANNLTIEKWRPKKRKKRRQVK